jgi:hypothetical protein
MSGAELGVEDPPRGRGARWRAVASDVGIVLGVAAVAGLLYSIIADNALSTAMMAASGGVGAFVVLAIRASRRSGAVPTALARTWWRRPPGLAFHLATAAAALGFLWSMTTPVWMFVLGMVCAFVLFGGWLVWLVRAAVYGVQRRRGTAQGHTWWLLVAPIGSVLLSAVLAFGVAFRVRWAGSRTAFDDAVEQVQGGERGVDVPTRIGWYDITRIRVDGDAVFFYEGNCGLVDDCGFAYLPDGPDPAFENGGFESPSYGHIGGPWYAFSAGW